MDQLPRPLFPEDQQDPQRPTLVSLPQDPKPSQPMVPLMGQQLLDSYVQAEQEKRLAQLNPTSQQLHRQMLDTMRSVQGVDPAKAGQQRTLAQKLQMPEQWVADNQAAAQQMADSQELEQLHLWRTNPNVMRMLTDPNLAKVSKGDLQSLIYHDDAFGWYWTKRQIATGIDQNRQGQIYQQILQSDGKRTNYQQAQLDEIEHAMRLAQSESGTLSPLLNVIGQIIDTAPKSAALSFAASQFAGSVASPLTAAAAATWTGIATTFAQTSYNAMGNAYGRMRDQMGLDHETALRYSLGEGLAEGFLEALGTRIAVAPFRSVLVARAAAKIAGGLTKQTTTTALRTFVMDTVKGFSGEAATEVSQTISSFLAESWAIQASKLDDVEKLKQQDKLGDLGDQIGDTLLQTVLGIGPLSVFMPAIRFGHDSRLARKAADDVALLQDLQAGKQDSKLAKLSPTDYRRMLAEQAQRVGAENVNVDARVLLQVITEEEQADLAQRAEAAGVTTEQMAAQMGQKGRVREQLAKAFPEQMATLDEKASKGELVAFPTGAYVDAVMGSTLGGRLMTHVKFDPRGMTAAEAKQDTVVRKELFAKAEAELAKSGERAKTQREQADGLRKILRQKFEGVRLARTRNGEQMPLTKDEIDAQVEVIVSIAVVGAAEDGVTVDEWFAENGFSVRFGEDAAEAYKAAQQGLPIPDPTKPAPGGAPQLNLGEGAQNQMEMRRAEGEQQEERPNLQALTDDQLNALADWASTSGMRAAQQQEIDAEIERRIGAPEVEGEQPAALGITDAQIEQMRADLLRRGEPEVLESPLTAMMPKTKNARQAAIENTATLRVPSAEVAYGTDEKTQEALAKNVALMQQREFDAKDKNGNPITVRAYDGLPKIEGTVQEQAEAIVEYFKDNLLTVLNRLPDWVIARSRLWYKGANRIAQGYSTRYGITLRQAAGGLAVLSPQADWRQNVSYFERICDILSLRQEHVWDEKMEVWWKSYWNNDKDKKARKEATKQATRDMRPLEKALQKAQDNLSQLDANTQKQQEARVQRDALRKQVKAAELVKKPTDEQKQALKELRTSLRAAEKTYDSFARIAGAQGSLSLRSAVRKAQAEIAEQQGRIDKIVRDERLVDSMRGLKLAELTSDEQRAIWIRAFDEAHNDRSFREILPEGEFGGKVTGETAEIDEETGKKSDKLGWKSFSTIAKAVSILRDGSERNITVQIGDMHKVRSFYNNIYDPDHPLPYFTSDTHQVAASSLLPLGASAPEVSHNFGSGAGVGRDGDIGLYGTYWVYAEAAIRAAKEYNEQNPGVQLRVREVQSITWEAVRSLFPAELKQDAAFVLAVRDIQRKHETGQVTYEAALQEVFDFARANRQRLLAKRGKDPKSDSGDFATPTWASIPAGSGDTVDQGAATYTSGLPAPDVRSELGSAFANQAGGSGGGGDALSGEPDVLRQDQIDDLDRLYVTHNIRAASLEHSLDMGGFAMPSLAVQRIGAGGTVNFGEVTLIGGKHLADPVTTPVFSADAYTPRWPDVELGKLPRAEWDRRTADLEPWLKRYDTGGGGAFYVLLNEFRVGQRRLNAIEFDAQRSVEMFAYWMHTKGLHVPDPVISEPPLDAFLGSAFFTKAKQWLSANPRPALPANATWIQADLHRIKTDDWGMALRDLMYEGLKAAAAQPNQPPQVVVWRNQLIDRYRAKYGASQQEAEENWMQELVLSAATIETSIKRHRSLVVTDRVATYNVLMKSAQQQLGPQTTEGTINADMTTFATNYVRALAGPKMVRVGKSLKPYTLENVVAAMRKRQLRGAETFGNVRGAAEARAASSMKFQTIEEMRALAKQLLASKVDVLAAQNITSQLIDSLMRRLQSHYTRDPAGVYENQWMLLVEAAKSKQLAANKKNRVAKATEMAARFGFALPPDAAEVLADVAEAFKATPLEYFEAKPVRVVRVNEFAGALVPDSTANDALAQRLADAGLQVRRTKVDPYGEGRLKEVRQFALELHQNTAEPDVLFQNTDDYYSAFRRAVETLPTKSASASGWLQAVQSIANKGQARRLEIDSTGIVSWLEGLVSDGATLGYAQNDPKLTQADVLAYLDNVLVRTETQIYADRSNSTDYDKAVNAADLALQSAFPSITQALTMLTDVEFYRESHTGVLAQLFVPYQIADAPGDVEDLLRKAIDTPAYSSNAELQKLLATKREAADQVLQHPFVQQLLTNMGLRLHALPELSRYALVKIDATQKTGWLTAVASLTDLESLLQRLQRTAVGMPEANIRALRSILGSALPLLEDYALRTYATVEEAEQAHAARANVPDSGVQIVHNMLRLSGALGTFQARIRDAAEPIIELLQRDPRIVAELRHHPLGQMWVDTYKPLADFMAQAKFSPFHVTDRYASVDFYASPDWVREAAIANTAEANLLDALQRALTRVAMAAHDKARRLERGSWESQQQAKRLDQTETDLMNAQGDLIAAFVVLRNPSLNALPKIRYAGTTTYAHYKPGGSGSHPDYAELLVTSLPVAQDVQGSGRTLLSADEYRSPHWRSSKNVLVHARVENMTGTVNAVDSDMLMVWEIQSDWGQAANEKGFDTIESQAQMQAAYDAAQQKKDEALQEWTAIVDAGPVDLLDPKTWKVYQALQSKMPRQGGSSPIPFNPLVQKTETWFRVGLGQAMLHAVRTNATHVVLPQASDIAPYVDSIRASDAVNIRVEFEDMRSYGGKAFFQIVSPNSGDSVRWQIPAEEVNEMTDPHKRWQRNTNYDASRVAKWLAKALEEKFPGIDAAKAVELFGGEQLLAAKWNQMLDDKAQSHAITHTFLAFGQVKAQDVGLQSFVSGNPGLRSYYDVMVPRMAKEFARMHKLQMEPVTVMVPRPYSVAMGKEVMEPQQRMAIKVSDALKAKPEMPLMQGPRGAYFQKSRTIALLEAADLSTFLHEASHWYMSRLFFRARKSTATQATRDQAHRVLRVLGVQSFEEWDALTQEEKERRHEQFAYNFEEYLRDGLAPSVELQSVFGRIGKWMRRLYANIRETLGPIYERLYGQPLPILTGDMRDVFDRMLATEDQIRTAQVVRDLTPMFQSEEEALAAGMTPEQWAQLQSATEDADEAAIARLATASQREMAAQGRARGRVLANMQAEDRQRRKELREEVEGELAQKRVYRLLRWLSTGMGADESDPERREEQHRISRESVERIVESGVEPTLPKTSPDSPQLERTEQALMAVQAERMEQERQLQVAQARLEELRAEQTAELRSITAQEASNVRPEVKVERRDRMAVRALARNIRLDNASARQIGDLLREQVLEEYTVPVAQAQRDIRQAQSRVDALLSREERIAVRMERQTPSVAEEVLDKLGRRVSAEGLDAMVVAERFGYEGGAGEMLREAFSAVPFAEAVETEVERRMEARYGDTTSSRYIEEQVADALHDDARTKMVRLELEWLERQAGRVGGDVSQQQQADRAAAQAALPAAEAEVERLDLLLSKLQESRNTQAVVQPIMIEMANVRDRMRKAREAGDQQAEGREGARMQVLQAELTAAQDPDVVAAQEQLTQAEAERRRLKALAEVGAVTATDLRNAAREAARQRVDRTVVGDLDATQHEIEEGRANRESMRMLKDGDEAGALAAKRRQLLQHEAVRETRAAQREVQNSVRRIQDAVSRKTENMAKTHNMDLVSAARVLAGMFGIGTQRQFERAMEQLRAIERYSPALWSRLQGIMGPMVTEVQDYQTMTVEQFREVAETIDGLLELARAEMQAEIAGQRQEVAEVQGELVASLRQHKAKAAGIGSASAVTARQGMMLWVSHIKALLRRVESWCLAIDGGRGAWVKKLYSPLKQALDSYKVRRNEMVTRYVRMVDGLNLNPDQINASEIGYTFGAGHNGVGMAELLGALLHTGNVSNYRKLLLGRGWATERPDGTLDDTKWRRFINRMHTSGVLQKKHYDWLQQVWDLTEEIKPDLQSAHRQVFGTYFREVQSAPIETPFGAYRGGYVPAKTDPLLVREAQAQQRMEELEGDFRREIPSVQSGWRHSRVEEYTRPLNLDIRMMARHIDETLRFVYVQPVLKQNIRVLRGAELQTALREVDPAAYEDMILPWLHRASRQMTSTPGMSKSIDRFWSGLRSRVGADRMFLNISNALQNFTGLFASMSQVSPRYMMSGLRAYMSGPPWKFAQDVANQSAYMNNLLNNQMVSMADRMDEIVRNPDAFGKLRNVATRNAYMAQTFTQNIVTLVTWKGAYDKTMARHTAGMTPEQAHAEAVAAADQIVRQTQSSLEPEDIARFEAATPFVRVFLQFGGFFNTLANTNATQFGNLFRKLGAGALASPLLYAQFVLGYAAPLIVADVISAAMAGRLPDDEDEDGYLDEITPFLAGSLFRGTASMVPIGGQMANALVNAMDDKPFNDRLTVAPAVQALESATIGVVRAGQALWEDDRDLTGRNIKDVLTLMAIVTGIPLAPVGRATGFALDEAQGRVVTDGVMDYATGLMSGSGTRPSR